MTLARYVSILLAVPLVLGLLAPAAAGAIPQEEGADTRPADAQTEDRAADEESAEPAEAGPSHEDRRIEGSLTGAFSRIDTLAEVDVVVRRGVVTLTGTVATQKAREDAATIATRLDPLFVVNRIAVATAEDEPVPVDEATRRTAADEDIADRIRRIFAAQPGLEEARVAVTGGVVRLSGVVDDPDAVDLAGELAGKIDGVIFVDNDLEASLAIGERVLPTTAVLETWGRRALAALPLILIALGVVVLAALLGRWIARREGAFRRVIPNPLLRDIVRQLVRVVLVILGLYLALEILGATALVGAVLGTAGIVGLALGFAFKDIAENYMASIILSARRPFRTKELVTIDGQMGTVVRLTTTDTVLMTPDGNHLRIPNAMVFKSKIVNLSANPRRRFDFGVGLGTHSDVAAAQRLGLEALRAIPGVMDDPAAYALVEELGDSTVNLRFFAWVDQKNADFLKVKSEAIRVVKTVFDDNDLDMPSPTFRIEGLAPGVLDEPPARPRPARRAAAPAAPEAEAPSPERQIAEQVQEDLERSGEEDLLTGRGETS